MIPSSLVGIPMHAVRLKREEREDLYIGGRGGVYTEELPEAQQICDELILALLDEFRKIRETLLNLGKKHIKHKLGLCMRSLFYQRLRRSPLNSLVNTPTRSRCFRNMSCQKSPFFVF